MRRGNSSLCLFVFSISALLVLATLPLSAEKKKASFHHTNLNTATAAELQQAPGIGPSSAARVLKMRKPYGPLRVHDLRAIKGIGPTGWKKCASI
jgi:DNA uptake protein ComE-like DNA-binding protein